MSKKGLLLVNLGTPDDPSVKSVRRYLRQFLSDPRVIDVPALVRFILLNAIILPFRPKQSAQAYRKIWQQDGSPLLTISQQFTQKLAESLGDEYQVVLAMRYGQPDIASAVKQLTDCQQLIVLPLFPQYASASTGSAIQAVLESIAKQWNFPSIRIISDFYQHPQFIRAYQQLLTQQLSSQEDATVLFSYHGLPQRQITKSGCKIACDNNDNPCPKMSDGNLFCYRAQCYQTSRLIADSVGLKPEQYHVAFQSRLGRTPWIKPYTDEVLPRLIKKGVKNLYVACPSFVADCLETLEEIGLQAKQQWLDLGGESFNLLPCLNADDHWVAAVKQMVTTD